MQKDKFVIAPLGIPSVYSNPQFTRSVTDRVTQAQQFNKALPHQSKPQKRLSLFLLVCMLIPLPFVAGCNLLPKTKADAQSQPPNAKGEAKATSVNVAIAKTGILQEPLQRDGTTQPIRVVSLRAQVEGRLLNLQVDMGDPVKQGQILARLDDSILVTNVTQGNAELAALQSEVARAQTQVQNARAQAAQAQAELQQAQKDAERLRSLSADGAIPKQQAELAQTEAATALQKLNAATAQIATEQQAVEAARGRVEAQRAVIAQAKERQSYALLASPINGIVLEKVNEPGNLLQPGGEVLKLGDFSQVKVVVRVSDTELSSIQVGQSAQVSLDAFANEQLTGQVTRISPAGDRDRLQGTVEITIPNSNGRIGSGLLARVSFPPTTAPRVVVPQSALQASGGRGRGGNNSSGTKSSSNLSSSSGNQGGSPRGGLQKPTSSKGTVFVVTGEGNQATVQARPVQIGTSTLNQVEILSGLKPGERFVISSEKPLKDGEKVRLSAAPQTSEKQEQR